MVIAENRDLSSLLEYIVPSSPPPPPPENLFTEARMHTRVHKVCHFKEFSATNNKYEFLQTYDSVNLLLYIK